MTIELKNIGKKFLHQWLYRNVSCTFESGESYAIIGFNGSGKSTLLQIIAGFQLPSEGTVQVRGKQNYIDNSFSQIAFAAPYMELIEELTASELFDFHSNFKQIELSKITFFEILRLETSMGKLVKHFSSGMKQRLKLGLAMYSKSSILILDEPTSNLDQYNSDWYNEEIVKISNLKQKTLIIASNLPNEYHFCTHIIDISAK